ncbi:hypothetical protein [Anatilimnocola floriformis]|uniref:hypothetical protein n=1 Tax=Anatilimnocola floriformis TaxID=2948575 RepID=UPI0020C38896|nr:hypothetical protein [Anatilimnocola floriformis]
MFLLLAAILGVAIPFGANGLVQVPLAILALTFAGVGLTYACDQPRWFGKLDDGTFEKLAWNRWVCYFLLIRLSLGIARLLNRKQPAIAEFAPGLWFGRRLTKREASQLPVEFAGVLDLAAEFSRVWVPTADYKSLPLLDGLPVSAANLRIALKWLAERRRCGNLFVHCALGHGRTGSIVLAWLLVKKQVPDAEEGIKKLQELRPGFGISTEQVASVEAFVRDEFATQNKVHL